MYARFMNDVQCDIDLGSKVRPGLTEINREYKMCDVSH